MNHVRYQLACLFAWALLLVLGLVQVAHAQPTATITQYTFNGGTGSPITSNWYNSAAEACSAGSAYWSTQNAPQSCTTTVCSGLPSPAYSCQLSGGFTYANGLSTRTTTGALPCPAAGTKAVRNFTIGYANSPNDGAPTAPEIAAYSALINSSRCSVGGGSSCAVTLAPQANMAYASTQPTSTGLYRISIDIEVTFSGSACTPSSAERSQSDSTNPVPPCPGTYGTVNGRAVCLPSTPPTPVPRPTRSDGTDVPVTTGNPPAGSNGNDSMGNRTPTSGTNGANNGSPLTNQDGLPVGWGKGMPSNAGTTAGSSAGSGTSLKAEDIKTDCDKYPNSVGCSQFGTADSGTLTTTNVALDTTPTPFASASGCPAPLTFSVMAATYTVSYQPLCDRLFALRVLFLLSASFIAAYIIANGFKS